MDFYRGCRPTNLLLMTRGYDHYQREHYLYTPGAREVDPRYHPGLKHNRVRQVRDMDSARPFHEVGCPVSYADSKPESDCDPHMVFAWLPAWFCPVCGQRDRPSESQGGSGVWWLLEDHPEIGGKRGQGIIYFCHGSCIDSEFHGKKKLELVNNGWDRLYADRHSMIEANIIGFLKAHRNHEKYFTKPDS